MMKQQARQPQNVSQAQALINEFRSQPATRAWLESRPEIIIRVLSLMLGLPDATAQGKPYTVAQLIDNMLASEWERTRR